MTFLDIIIGGMQDHQSVKTDGICTCLTSSMGTGGGYIPMIVLIGDCGNEYDTKCGLH